MSLSAVCLRLQSDTRDDVLRELVRLIPELRDRPAEQITMWQALVDREKLHTTAVGGGLAFPHARNAMGNVLKTATVIMGRHAKGVAWNSPDNQPVKLFFLLAAPSLTEHLHLLANMSRVLRNPKTRDALLAAPTEAAIAEIIKTASNGQ
jgi:mannitol/fructose-specific phosphotransferase system IIA component (Ntr-type)